MSSTYFRDVVEPNIINFLPRHLRRADGKFTPTERARLQASFQKAWNVALELTNPESAPSAEKSLYEMELKEHLRLREIAVLIFSDFDEAAREKLASSPPEDGADSKKNFENDEAMLKAFEMILSSFNERVSTERYGGWNIPEGAPRDLFTFFDEWQDEVDDCVPLRSGKE